MSQTALLGRCSFRHVFKTTGTTRLFARANSTQEQLRLETPEDWQAFRERRADAQYLLKFFEKYGSTQNSENTWKLRDGLHNPQAEVTMSALLAAGAHFGHASTRMNPNFVPYAYGTRAGITIIDLDHTVPMLRRAVKLVRAVARAGGIVVFIGTRPDIRPVVIKAAGRLGAQGFYVGERWLPGTLTNRRQLFGDEDMEESKIIPDLAIILNPLQNKNAIKECAIEHVPTIGIIDSNVDPRLVMYPIPANDESTRTAELIAGILSIAGMEGHELYKNDELSEVERARKVTRLKTNHFISKVDEYD